MKCRKHIDNKMNDENQPEGGIEIVNRVTDEALLAETT